MGEFARYSNISMCCIRVSLHQSDGYIISDILAEISLDIFLEMDMLRNWLEIALRNDLEKYKTEKIEKGSIGEVALGCPSQND